MLKKQIVLIFAVVMLAAVSTVGFAYEKAEGAEHKCWAKENPEKAAALVDLAVKAEGGCEHSKAALIAKTKEIGCEETAELAAKAEGGCEKSAAALIAKVKGMGDEKCKCGGECKGEHAEHKAEGGCKEKELATLASHADGGCPEAKAKLIAWAKEHGCEESKVLAAKAEGGCDKSMQKLVAMAKEKEEKAE